MEDNYIIAPVVEGQVYEPVVKVGDTLPIGAIIGFDTTGTIPNGWEYYAENQIKKIAPVTPANGNIENTYGTSQENTYSQEFINGAINDQSSNIITIPHTAFAIATNHILNTLSIKYNKATGLCLLSFRITTKDNDPQYNTFNAWQNQFTIPTKYAPPSLVFNAVYNGNGTVGVVRVQPSSDSTNKGKVDVYGHASYFLTEGNICWYTDAGIE